jgi:WD40 repeat protein
MNNSLYVLLICFFLLFQFLPAFVSEGPILYDISAYPDEIRTVKWSPDDSTFCSVALNNATGKLWDPDTFKYIPLTGHSKGIWRLQYFPDGSKIVTGSDDKTLKIWDAHTGVLIRTLSYHDGKVTAIAVSHNNQFIASGGADNTVKIWNVNNGQCARTIITNLWYHSAIAFSPDDSQIAVSTWYTNQQGGEIRIWNVNTGAFIREYPTIEVYDLLWSNTGNYLLSGNVAGQAQLWSVSSSALLYTFSRYSVNIASISFSPQYKYFVVAYVNGSLCIWNTINRQFIGEYNCTATLLSVDWSHDGRYLLTGYVEGQIRIWSVDFDGDGLLDFLDNDIDGDGWNNTIELEAGTDPYNTTNWPSDIDGDHIPDIWDDDKDGDGYFNPDDAFPEDPAEWNDTDHDGIGDNSDPDIDGDGWNNTIEIQAGTDPYDATDYPGDIDGDNIPDILDDDVDGDGFANNQDSFPSDPLEWNDTDHDGLGDNSDPDIDGDGYLNDADVFPYNSTEWNDTDLDGIGDNLDLDDDNDGWDDLTELAAGTDPQNPDSVPLDQDADLIPDVLDDDLDGDGYPNLVDAFPDNVTEWNDTDHDGIGDNTDPDIDGDGWNNTIELEVFTDPFDNVSYPADRDGDRIPDPLDLVDDRDRDADGFLNALDAFPDDPAEWNDTDHDGIGDNTDPDIDGDGHPNDQDAYPWDPARWQIDQGDDIGPGPGPGPDDNGSVVPGQNDTDAGHPDTSSWVRPWMIPAVLVFCCLALAVSLVIAILRSKIARRPGRVPAQEGPDDRNVLTPDAYMSPKRPLSVQLGSVLPPVPQTRVQVPTMMPVHVATLPQYRPAQMRYGYAHGDKRVQGDHAQDEPIGPVWPLRKRTRPVVLVPKEEPDQDDVRKLLTQGDK